MKRIRCENNSWSNVHIPSCCVESVHLIDQGSSDRHLGYRNILSSNEYCTNKPFGQPRNKRITLNLPHGRLYCTMSQYVIVITVHSIISVLSTYFTVSNNRQITSQ